MTEGSPRDRELRRYETILDSLDDAVYAVRPDGTIAYVNDRYAEMKGVSREALLGTDIYDWVTEETAEKATQVRNEMAAGDRDVGMVEYEFLTADGERFPAEMRFNRVTGEEGEELNRVGVIRDVRERKRREEALRRKNERARGVREHRLARPPEPLNVAQGRLDLAREEYDSEHLEVVANAHERMAALIDDLLTLARDGEGVEETEGVPPRTRGGVLGERRDRSGLAPDRDRPRDPRGPEPTQTARREPHAEQRGTRSFERRRYRLAMTKTPRRSFRTIPRAAGQSPATRSCTPARTSR